MLVYTDAGLDVLLCKLCTMYFIVHDVTTNIPWCKSKLQKLLLVFLPCVGVSDMFHIESSVLKPVVFANVNVKGLEMGLFVSLYQNALERRARTEEGEGWNIKLSCLLSIESRNLFSFGRTITAFQATGEIGMVSCLSVLLQTAYCFDK